MNKHKKTSFIFLVILAMMSMSGLIATDIFLPAIPNLILYFSLNKLEAQSLISIYLFGIAIMQLIYGPISDSFGRKTILIIGTAIFCLSSLLIATVNTYFGILTMRLLQAIGACVGLTLGRAIVGDLFNKEQAGKIFLTIFPFVGVVPAIAPAIGGWLNTNFNWQSCFYFTSLFAMVLLILIVFSLKETKEKKNRVKFSVINIIYSYKNIIINPKFWAYTSCVCVSYAAYFIYISESPFLLLQQGLTAHTLGYSFISLSIMYVLGNITARKLIKKYSLDYSLMVGYIIFVCGGTLFCIALNTFPEIFTFSLMSMSILTFGNGFLLPLGTAGGITVNTQLTGSASGVLGSMQLLAGALAAQLIGIFSNNDPSKIGFIMLVIVWCGFLIHLRFFKPYKTITT